MSVIELGDDFKIINQQNPEYKLYNGKWQFVIFLNNKEKDIEKVNEYEQDDQVGSKRNFKGENDNEIKEKKEKKKKKDKKKKRKKREQNDLNLLIELNNEWDRGRGEEMRTERVQTFRDKYKVDYRPLFQEEPDFSILDTWNVQDLNENARIRFFQEHWTSLYRYTNVGMYEKWRTLYKSDNRPSTPWLKNERDILRFAVKEWEQDKTERVKKYKENISERQIRKNDQWSFILTHYPIFMLNERTEQTLRAQYRNFDKRATP